MTFDFLTRGSPTYRRPNVYSRTLPPQKRPRCFDAFPALISTKPSFRFLRSKHARTRHPSPAKTKQVVANCVVVLNEIMSDAGGMATNTAIVHHLLGRLEDFNEWGVCHVLALVSRSVSQPSQSAVV